MKRVAVVFLCLHLYTPCALPQGPLPSGLFLVAFPIGIRYAQDAEWPPLDRRKEAQGCNDARSRVWRFSL